MTWNVENLFEPAEAQRAAYDAKLDSLAAVVLAAAPDLLAVQEVGDPASFDTLRDHLGPAWTGVLSTHSETPHTIRVGWLSAHPLADVEEVTDLPAALAPSRSPTTAPPSHRASARRTWRPPPSMPGRS